MSRSDADLILDTIMSRHSVRRFDSSEVPTAWIDRILAAAKSAPSAMNQRPWEFTVIRDKNILEQLSQAGEYAAFVKNAPCCIVICCNIEKIVTRTQEYFVQDCSASAQNILLAAHALGLGATWVGVYPNHQKVLHIRRVLALPGHLIPFCLIPLGYPAGQSPSEYRVGSAK